MQSRRLLTSRAGVLGAGLACVALLAACGSSPSSSSGSSSSSTAALAVSWMPGFDVPGTPPNDDKVGVLKVGASSAKNVLVLEPGTSAGSAYFVPLAKWIVSSLPGWQVWSVERRQNLLEDQSELDLYKQRKVTATELYDYYLGYLTDRSVTHHFQSIPDSSVEFAKDWGMDVAVQDLRLVIAAASRFGGRVVLGGHSLGGSVVTAYATWDFGGHPGADGLAGLVYIDGGSGPPVSVSNATTALQALDNPTASPWLSFGGITAPYAGLFSATGGASTVYDPNAPSLGQTSGLLPTDIVPAVRVTNAGQFGYALNVATSPPSLEAAQAHLGTGVSSTGPVHGWDGTGALTPISRYATMLSGAGVQSVDGTEWYFPQRLTDDTGAVGNGNANPAQSVLGVDATMGHELPHSLLVYAIATSLGGPGVLDAARSLAAQSGIASSNLTLVDEHTAYAHNDPAGAYPNNAFFDHLVPFLQKVSPGS
jgi:hypothetical protein